MGKSFHPEQRVVYSVIRYNVWQPFRKGSHSQGHVVSAHVDFLCPADLLSCFFSFAVSTIEMKNTDRWQKHRIGSSICPYVDMFPSAYANRFVYTVHFQCLDIHKGCVGYSNRKVRVSHFKCSLKSTNPFHQYLISMYKVNNNSHACQYESVNQWVHQQ